MKPRTWPADRWPTPEEWLDWLLDNDREDQLRIAGRALQMAQDAHRCFELHRCPGACQATVIQ